MAREQELKINFDVNRTAITTRENAKIRRIVAVLNEYPDATVTVIGFADKFNLASANTSLALERVEMVRMALTDAGIPISRINTDYYGDPSLITDSDKARVVLCITQ